MKLQDEVVFADVGSAMTLDSVPLREARTCAQLLHEYRPARRGHSELIRFAGVGPRDVYNVTAPFQFDGQRLMAGRVEHRSDERSDIVLFRDGGREWLPCFTSSMFHLLQDPCIAFVNGELVIGGVRYPVPVPGGEPTWQMEFFRGRSLNSLRPFLKGPLGMKDIRFCGLRDGRVAVFSRPQGAKGGRGRIGFALAPDLDAVTSEMIQDAPLLPGQFAAGEWGGANEAHILANGRIGVLGHVACWDSRGGRHYYPMTFTLDPEGTQTTPIHVIARRDDFPAASPKREDLLDVVFTGGLERTGDGWADLYAGLSDSAAGILRIPDPFLQPVSLQ